MTFMNFVIKQQQGSHRYHYDGGLTTHYTCLLFINEVNETPGKEGMSALRLLEVLGDDCAGQLVDLGAAVEKGLRRVLAFLLPVLIGSPLRRLQLSKR